MEMHGSFHVYRNDPSQSVSADTCSLKFILNAERYDTDSYFDSDLTNYRYTSLQLLEVYFIYGQTRSSVALTAHYSAIYKNGSKILQAHQ